MLSETNLQNANRSNSLVESGQFQVPFNDVIPGIPVRPETLLVLELNLRQHSIDLCAISQLVLADMGATLQVMQRAGREYGSADERPVRIEDCISELGLDACFTAIAAQPTARHASQLAISKLWSHSREIAKYSRLVAEEVVGVNPEEAHVAGLFHAIGLLPEALGWASTGINHQPLRMATQWSLPQCALDLFSEPRSNRRARLWSEILRKAHQRASRASHHEQGIASHLIRTI